MRWCHLIFVWTPKVPNVQLQVLAPPSHALEGAELQELRRVPEKNRRGKPPPLGIEPDLVRRRTFRPLSNAVVTKIEANYSDLLKLIP